MTEQTTAVAVQNDTRMSVADIRGQVNAIQELMRGAFQDKQHYGVIPGCGDKPTLLKPGAEKISMMFRLVPSYEVLQSDLSGGHREYRITCTLTYAPTGSFCGQGVGCASTMEGKFRFRSEATGKEVPKEYWKHRDIDLIGGEGFTTRKTDGKWMIYHRVEHDNPADYYNTILKMGKKRAHVDAVLTATAASDIFTQDIEDLPQAGETPSPKNPPVNMPTEKATDKSKAASGNEITGTVERITTTNGTNKNGAWTRTSVCVSGEWYGTFNEPLGEQVAAMEGVAVILTWKQDGDYKTLLTIRAAQEEASREVGEDPLDEANQEPLPFDDAPDFVKELKALRNDRPKVWRDVAKRFGIKSDDALELLEPLTLKKLVGAMNNSDSIPVGGGRA